MPFLKPYKAPRSRILQELTKKNGLRHAIFTVSGDKYVGEWKDNLQHGKGAHLSRSGRLYEGDWEAGRRHGYGVLSQLREDGTYLLLYEGDWVRGKPEGLGRKHYPHDEYYEGEVRESRRHGVGKMWFSDGSFYDGEWRADVREGMGLFVAANGNRYEGEWKGDQKHGYGEFYHLQTGQKQSGVWSGGVCVLSTLEDMPYRQTCRQPTPYPITEIELLDPGRVLEAEQDRVAAEQDRVAAEQAQSPAEQAELQLPPVSPIATLSPWFYIDCCGKEFPSSTLKNLL